MTYTEGLDPTSVPSPLLIVDKKRAVSEMIYAIERGKPHHVFPKRIRWLVRFARLVGVDARIELTEIELKRVKGLIQRGVEQERTRDRLEAELHEL